MRPDVLSPNTQGARPRGRSAQSAYFFLSNAFCVTLIKAVPAWLKRSMTWAKSSSERDRRSTSLTTTMSILPASMSASRRWNAGRSRLAPVKPPSSYCSLIGFQPSCAWALMYRSQDSRWV